MIDPLPDQLELEAAAKAPTIEAHKQQEGTLVWPCDVCAPELSAVCRGGEEAGRCGPVPPLQA